MCVIYVITVMVICVWNLDRMPAVFALIFNQAFQFDSVGRGVLGTAVLIGIRRALISNEAGTGTAGTGTAGTAHAAAHTAHPVCQGVVSSLGPFIDTIVVCGATASVILLSGYYGTESYAKIDEHDDVSPVADFSILIYPAYTTTEPETVDPLLLEKKPSRPLFVATALDDKWTQGQFFYLHERLKAKQRVEYHIYENGGRGKGIFNGKAFSFGQWPRECARWLADLQLRSAGKKAK